MRVGGFLEILKRLFQDIKKIVDKCFPGCPLCVRQYLLVDMLAFHYVLIVMLNANCSVQSIVNTILELFRFCVR